MRTLKRLVANVVVLGSTIWCGRADAAISMFMGLGDLPGADFSSTANGVSADGSVVVGRGSAFITMHGEPISSLEAFRWTQGGGMVDLGDLPGGPYGHIASGASSDGSVVVGSSVNRAPVPNGEAFRWRQSTGAVGLGDLPGGYSYSAATGVSADGSAIVGYSGSASGYEAFRWTQGGGMVGLGDLPGAIFDSRAYAVSADGSVVVGRSIISPGPPPAAPTREAFRWQMSAGMVGLGDLPGGDFLSDAFDVSADGSVIVGRGNSVAGFEAFRWTQGSGMVGLGDLLGGTFSSTAYGVSADGTVVVGQGSSTSGSEAFLWDAAHGMRSLRDALVNNFGLGASLAGWTLTSATDISADGQFIVGNGRNPNGDPEAWLARLGPEPALPGDYNGDGTVGPEDYDLWKSNFGSTTMLAADGNRDGIVNAADYTVWRDHLGSLVANGGVSSAIPEPASLALAFVAAALLYAHRLATRLLCAVCCARVSRPRTLR